MNWNEMEERPNWPSELDEPVAKLGSPLEVYRTSRRKALLKLLLGIGLVLLGVLINYLYWWLFAGPVIPDKFFFLFLFGTPIAGLGLLYAAYRDRGMWVLEYPMGLLRWHRGEVVSFPWDEIFQMNLHRITHCEDLQTKFDAQGEVESVALDLEGASARILGSYVMISRTDGVRAYFPSSLEGYAELGEKIQRETFKRLWPSMWERYQRGEMIQFDDLAIGWAGLLKGEESLPWLAFGGAKIANSRLIISRTGKWRAWTEVAIHDVDNPHLLLALLKAGQPLVATNSEGMRDEG